MRRVFIFLAFLFSLSLVVAQDRGFVLLDSVFMKIDTTNYRFVLYSPEQGCRFAFVRERPDSLDENIGFSVVAAFTSRAPEHIVGTNVCNGVLSNDSTEKETGYCLITNKRIEIKPLSMGREEAIAKAVNYGWDYFQQKLLIYEGKPIATSVFRNRTTARRALALKNNKAIVVETDDRIHIDTFTNCLIEMGCDYAIYLDMGSWSEGWYKTTQGEIKRIGTNWRSSHLQTNWLIIRKD